MPRRAPDGAYVAGRPLGGAHIALDCDGGALAQKFESDAQGRVFGSRRESFGSAFAAGSAVKLGTSDAAGRFESKGVGWLDASCAVEITADGYYPERVQIGDVCVQREGDSCHALRVDVELVPKA